METYPPHQEYESELDEPASKKQKTIQEYTVPKQNSMPSTPKSSAPSSIMQFGMNSVHEESDKEEDEPTPSNFVKQQEAISSSKNIHSLSSHNLSMNSSATNIAKYEETIQALRRQIEERDQKILGMNRKVKDYEQKLHDISEEHKKAVELRQQRYNDSFIDILTKLAEQERKEDKIKMNENCIKIGTIVYQKTIGDAFEVWQDGDLFIDLERKQQLITAEREKLEKQKKQIQKTRSSIKKENTGSATNSASTSNNQLQQSDIILNDLNEQEEIYKLRLSQIKKEEATIQTERERLTILKSIQIREIKRIRDQDRSRFKSPTLIHNRYFLMKLLGRGGFSEVY